MNRFVRILKIVIITSMTSNLLNMEKIVSYWVPNSENMENEEARLIKYGHFDYAHMYIFIV